MAPTYLESLAVFTNFLTAYTHTLLYLRELYPQTSFARSRFHNTPVYQSRHPLVCEWIRDAIAAVREELLKGSVERIGIVVYSYPETGSGSPKIMERYMFDVSAFPVVEKNERNVEIEWEEGATPNVSEDEEEEEEEEDKDAGVMERRKTEPLDTHVEVDLSEQFRAAFVALSTRSSSLAPLPPNCSFNVSMELKDEGDIDPPIGHAQPWIPVQPSLQKTGRNATSRDEDDEADIEAGTRRRDREGGDLGGARVTPIRAVEAGVFRFETWIEEGKAKFED